MPQNDDDALSILLGLGILTLVGVGAYKVLKAIAGYEKNEVINTQQATEIAAVIPQTYTPSYADDDYYPDYEGEDLEAARPGDGCAGSPAG
jgi:hypothetical protein